MLGVWEFFWDLWPSGIVSTPLHADLCDTFYVGADGSLCVAGEVSGLAGPGPESSMTLGPDLGSMVLGPDSGFSVLGSVDGFSIPGCAA